MIKILVYDYSKERVHTLMLVILHRIYETISDIQGLYLSTSQNLIRIFDKENFDIQIAFRNGDISRCHGIRPDYWYTDSVSAIEWFAGYVGVDFSGRVESLSELLIKINELIDISQKGIEK